MMPRLRIGCTGWGYDDWRGPFYPEGATPSEFLSRYSRVFDTVEVDSTYYAIPPKARVARWAEATPAGFTFAVKLPGLITHDASLRGVDDVLGRFLAVMEPLRESNKLGPLLIQFPATFVPARDAKALEDFLDALPQGYRWAVELRNDKWWTSSTYDILKRANASLVWSFNQYADVPPEETADFLYLRFIGDRKLTRFNEIQRDWSHHVVDWKARLERAERAGDAYLFVNNHFMGYAPGTAVIVQQLLGAPVADATLASRTPGQVGLGDFA